MAVFLVFMTSGMMPGPAAADPAEPILQLTPDIDRYFLGPYIAYMEDPQKKLTIDDVSSPQMSARFVGHAGKIINLGLNSSAYWIRFTINAFKDQISQKKWLLYFDWPNRIDFASLYIPKFPDAGWFAKEVGRILPTGPDPQPSTPAAFLPPESFIQPVTFYLRVESSEAKLIPLQILTDVAYQGVSRTRSLWFGVYYGIMLAISFQSILVPPIFLVAALICWRRGFRPARFFLLAFALLALSTMYEASAIFGVVPYLTPYSGQFGSAIEVILLQLALADRFRTLSLEHDMIKQSLDLAREVQQNLLPNKNPQMERLDIAGRSIYCDETGGDYYDFITRDTDENGQLTIAIGDVSGHGISSALLMATVRSSLRQRLSQPGDAGGIISDVNHQLVQDVEDSGQFMTLFYLNIDAAKMHAHWVRAGHDPAIFYDPAADAFEELGGSGIALGIEGDWRYKEYLKTDLDKGQIIFLSTDGIWEAFNPKGDMFGKERIYDIIRKNSSLTANEIITIILESLKRFQQGAQIEDDITLVVIKIT